MDARKNEIKGILYELSAVMIYILLLFSVSVIMR